MSDTNDTGPANAAFGSSKIAGAHGSLRQEIIRARQLVLHSGVLTVPIHAFQRCHVGESRQTITGRLAFVPA